MNNINPVFLIEGLQHSLRLLKNYGKGGGVTKQQAEKAIDKIQKSKNKSASKMNGTSKSAQRYVNQTIASQTYGGPGPTDSDAKAYKKYSGAKKNYEKATKALSK